MEKEYRKKIDMGPLGKLQKPNVNFDYDKSL